jgi:hypothetical protein
MKSFFDKLSIDKVILSDFLYFDSSLNRVNKPNGITFHSNSLNVKNHYGLLNNFNELIKHIKHISVSASCINSLPDNLFLSGLTIEDYNGEYIDKKINTTYISVFNGLSKIKKRDFNHSDKIKFKCYL